MAPTGRQIGIGDTPMSDRQSFTHVPATIVHLLEDAGGPRLIDRDECLRRRVGRMLVWAVLVKLTEHVDRRTNVTSRSHAGIADVLDIRREEVSRAVAVIVASGLMAY